MTRVVVAGAGALGSVYGGLLAAAGFDVVLLAHGAHANALRRRPLTIQLPTHTVRVRVRIEMEDEADILLLTAKTFDTDAVLNRVEGRPLLTVSFQNGLEKNEPLRKRFGPETVVGGVSTVAAALAAPGVVRCANLGMTFVGLATDTPLDRASLATMIGAAGFPIEEVQEITDIEWSKLAQVTALMAVQVITGLYVHDIFASPEPASLVKLILEEVDSLALTAGIELNDRAAPFPLVAVARARRDEGLELLRLAGERMRDNGLTTMRTSMLQSLEARRQKEVEAIHGAIVRYANKCHVPVPATTLCYRAITSRERQGLEHPNQPDLPAGAQAAARVLDVLEDQGDGSLPLHSEKTDPPV
jgi:2-dehydropantoate 2-reductase